MTKCEVGDIVSVEFPFSDLQGRKRRPGLVLASDAQDVLLARLTTHPPREARDLALADWSGSGLPKPSTVRLRKLAVVDVRLVHHKIGGLSARDADSVARGGGTTCCRDHRHIAGEGEGVKNNPFRG